MCNHHNALKVLVSVLPNSMIAFVSRAYEGRILDKDLTIESEFLQTLPPFTILMADKGFNISEECHRYFLSLAVAVPPGRRSITDALSCCSEDQTDCHNAKRISVEQVIRRLKTFKLLKNELPILALLHNIDDVILVCAALSNLKKSVHSF